MNFPKLATGAALFLAGCAFLLFGLTGAIGAVLGFAVGWKLDATIQATRRIAARLIVWK